MFSDKLVLGASLLFGGEVLPGRHIVPLHKNFKSSLKINVESFYKLYNGLLKRC